MSETSTLLDKLRIDRDVPPPPRRHWRMTLLVGLVLIAVVTGAAAYYQSPASTTAAPQAATQTAAAQAEATPPAAGSSAALDASGYVTAQRQATVSAKVTGRLAEVLVQTGQRVKKGEVIARLDASNAEAAVHLARANLSAAETAYDDAKPIYARQRRLVAAGAGTQAALDTAKAEFDSARATVGMRRAALMVAQRALDDTTIRAPFSGVVTDRTANEGEIVSPVSAGGGFTRTGICTIVDMSTLEVETDVNENFINRIHRGQPATVQLSAYPDWQIPAKVLAIVPAADRAKGTVRVRLGFDHPDKRILPDMSARVTFGGKAAQRAADNRPAAIIRSAAN